VVVLCAALLTGCTDSDSLPQPDGARAPGRPLQTLSADGLPQDFPRDEVPVIDGEVTSVQQGNAKNPGYAIAVVVDGEPAAAMGKAVRLLEAAGWDQRSEGSGGRVEVLRKDGGQVILTTAATSGHALVSYAIDLTS
jgi:hypothetical protein